MKRRLAWYVLGTATLLILAAWAAMQRYEFIPAHVQTAVYKHDRWTGKTYLVHGTEIHRVASLEEQKKLDEQRKKEKERKKRVALEEKKAKWEACLKTKAILEIKIKDQQDRIKDRLATATSRDDVLFEAIWDEPYELELARLPCVTGRLSR